LLVLLFVVVGLLLPTSDPFEKLTLPSCVLFFLLAATVLCRRPTTPLRPTPLSTPATTSLATSLAATPETTTREATGATKTTATAVTSMLMKPTAPAPTNNRKTSYRPTSAAAIRRILSQRKATVAKALDREGPMLLAKYVPILPRSPKVDFGFQTALKAARSVRNQQNRTSRAPSRSQSGRRSYRKSSTKRSFVPVVAMVRPQLTNFRGLHFQS
jgi:hypothetical protein